MAPPKVNKRLLYVGGLADEVVEETLQAAFLPFGDLVEVMKESLFEVNLPKDFAKNTTRGFAFVEFEDEHDADEARFNMNGAELFGRTLRVNVAKAVEHKLGSNKAVWSSEEWYKSLPENSGEPPAGAPTPA